MSRLAYARYTLLSSFWSASHFLLSVFSNLAKFAAIAPLSLLKRLYRLPVLLRKAFRNVRILGVTFHKSFISVWLSFRDPYNLSFLEIFSPSIFAESAIRFISLIILSSSFLHDGWSNVIEK